MKRLFSIIILSVFTCCLMLSCSDDSASTETGRDTNAEISLEDLFSRQTFYGEVSSLAYRQGEICREKSGKPILVLYLHGGTSRGSDNAAQLNEPAVLAIYKYLSLHNIPATMIVPQCPENGGWTSQNRSAVNALMKTFASDGVHDADRVYILGGSMGGTGTWCQLSNFPGFYAAAMPVAGNPTGMAAVNVAKTPVRTVMGTEDDLMSIPTVEEFRTKVLAAGGTLQLDIETGWSHVETCQQSFTDERLGWLFANVRNSLAEK